MDIISIISDLIKQLFPLLAVASVFIEVSPIKVNPLKWLLKSIGKEINGEIHNEIKLTKQELEKLAVRVDENEIDRIRYEILDFANSCKNGRKHTKDEFQHIIEINKKYHDILDMRKKSNGLVDIEYEYVLEVYKTCIEKGTLL